MSTEQQTVDEELQAETIGLHSLKPAPGSRKRPQARRARPRLRPRQDRPGAATRATARAPAPRTARSFEGGQNPIHMRMRKLRGPNKKMSMPFELFRTHTQHVNLDDLARRVSTTAPRWIWRRCARAGLAKKRDVPVKILGRGELTKKFTVHAHRFSASARERIEGAGGACQVVEE